MIMELLQLRYFLESAKNESFAKTAEKYSVPATSISASVKRLEKELGCEMFNRSCNRITLNEKGKRFMQSLSLIFEELDSAVDAITSLSTDTREIKLLVRAMRGKITDYIIDYKSKHPHISFKTCFDFNETNLENYDIIIDEKCDNYPNYDSIDLYTTKIRLRVSSNSALCGKKLTLKDLSNQPFVSIGENNSMHKILISSCKKAGFTPNIVVNSNDILCNTKCVEAGVGIGLGREYPYLVKKENTEFLNVTDFNEKTDYLLLLRKTVCLWKCGTFPEFFKN